MLGTIVGDKEARAQITSVIQAANEKGRTRGLEQLSQRLKQVLSGHLQTSNPAFEQKVREARLLRFQGAVERYRLSKTPSTSNLLEVLPDSPGTEFTIDMRDTASLVAELHISNSQNLEDEIHNTLKAYYEIARNGFIEFAIQIVVEQYLNDAQGPMLIFSPIYVAELTDEELRRIAVEEELLIRQRAELKATIERINHAERIAMKYN